MNEHVREPIRRLIERGDARGDWPDYTAEYGLTADDVPALVRIAIDPAYDELDSEDPRVYAPIHAWRAVGQLRGEEAVEPLLGLLRKIEETGDDWTLSELPTVFGLIGPNAIPALTTYLADSTHPMMQRVAASSGLEKIGSQHPHARERSITIIGEQLRKGNEDDAELHGFLVADLIELHATEALPAIRNAYQRGVVDESIAGCLEDVEIDLGVRQPTPEDMRRRRMWEVPVTVPATVPAWSRVGRNDPCPCGSGKKFKKCCLGKR